MTTMPSATRFHVAHTPRRPICRVGRADPRPVPEVPAITEPRLAAVRWRAIPGFSRYWLSQRGLVASHFQEGRGIRVAGAFRRLLRPWWTGRGGGSTLAVALYDDERDRYQLAIGALVGWIWGARDAEWFARRIDRFRGGRLWEREEIWLPPEPVLPADRTRCSCCGRPWALVPDSGRIEG